MSARAGLTLLESQLLGALARERLWIGALLLVLLVLLASWGWLIPAALDMGGDMRGLAAWMAAPRTDLRYAGLLCAMWFVMMTAMMLPAAAPTLLLYARVLRSQPGAAVVPQVYAFGLGYLGAWLGFSGAATVAQLSLHRAAALTLMMRLDNRYAAAALLLLAGAYQWSPLKQGCLARCRSPAAFISQHWHPGLAGAARMGLHHGFYCLGCCWALMLLLFVGGVMSLGWILALTAVVLLEKLAPAGAHLGRILGLLLVGAAALQAWQA